PCDWLLDKYRANAGRRGLAIKDDQLHYAAFVETMDHLVGRLLAAIDEAGLAGNTLVVFTADNGADPRFPTHEPFRGSKWTLYEAGVRVPLLARWPGVIAGGSTCETPVTGVDFFPTFCELA